MKISILILENWVGVVNLHITHLRIGIEDDPFLYHYTIFTTYMIVDIAHYQIIRALIELSRSVQDLHSCTWYKIVIKWLSTCT